MWQLFSSPQYRTCRKYVTFVHSIWFLESKCDHNIYATIIEDERKFGPKYILSESIWNTRITKRYEFYSWAIHSRVVLNPRARQIALDTMISYLTGQSSPLQLSAFERLSGPCHPSSLGWEICLSRAVVLIVLSLNSHFHWKFQVLQCISSSVSQLLFGSLFWLLGVSFFPIENFYIIFTI